MKKQIFIGVLFLSIFFPVLSPAQAVPTSGFMVDLQKQTNAVAGTKGANLGKAQDPRAIVARIIKIFLGTLGILLVVYIIYGGSLIFLSGGSEDKITQGKDVIKRAVLGMVIVMGAYSITIFVTSIVQNSDPCAPDENGNVDCTVIQEDRTKYNKKDYDNTNPFTPYNCKYLPDGTCDLSG